LFHFEKERKVNNYLRTVRLDVGRVSYGKIHVWTKKKRTRLLFKNELSYDYHASGFFLRVFQNHKTCQSVYKAVFVLLERKLFFLNLRILMYFNKNCNYYCDQSKILRSSFRS